MARAGVLARVKDRCRTLRTAVLDARAAPAEEVARYWPGGAENPDKDLWGWIYCYGNLARFMERAQQAESEVTPKNTATLITAMQGVPRVVPLTVPVVIDGVECASVRVAPKSWAALWRLAVLARIGTQLLAHVASIEGVGADPELQRDAHDWILRVSLQLAWGASQGDPGGHDYALPWDARTVAWPDVPEWLEALTPADRINIEAAFLEVHGRALVALEPYLAPSEGHDPLAGWHTLFSAYATEHGLDARTLMEDRAFQPFLIQLSLAAHQARTARADAERDADTDTVRAGVAAGMVS